MNIRSIAKESAKQALAYGLKIAEEDNYLLDIAFIHLIIAQAYQALKQSETASLKFDLAVKAILKENSVLFIPEFYLARADFCLSHNQLNQIKADLNSAWETIERCGMKLYAVDYL